MIGQTLTVQYSDVPTVAPPTLPKGHTGLIPGQKCTHKNDSANGENPVETNLHQVIHVAQCSKFERFTAYTAFC